MCSTAMLGAKTNEAKYLPQALYSAFFRCRQLGCISVQRARIAPSKDTQLLERSSGTRVLTVHLNCIASELTGPTKGSPKGGPPSSRSAGVSVVGRAGQSLRKGWRNACDAVSRSCVFTRKMFRRRSNASSSTSGERRLSSGRPESCPVNDVRARISGRTKGR